MCDIIIKRKRDNWRQKIDPYILVAKVEDKLFGHTVLPPDSPSLCQGDVELQGGVGGQVSQVRWSTNFNTRLPIKFHWHAHLDVEG